jgi:hypothetical protein
LAGYQVITQALREEAKKWDEMTPRVETVRREVESAWLSPLAFFVGDPVTLSLGFVPTDILLRADAYEEFRAFIETALRGAETEFGQIADALIKIAGLYEQAERENKIVEFNNVSDLFTA